MSDGLFARWWPVLYQTSPPWLFEAVEEPEPGKVPGFIDESN
jgi:hypothetical protein